MNLNAMRHPENLFGLLDDANTFDVNLYNNPYLSPPRDGSYEDRKEGPTRTRERCAERAQLVVRE